MKNINSSQGSSLHCFYTNNFPVPPHAFQQQQTIRIFLRCTLHTCRGTLHAYTLHLNDMCFETTAGARAYPQAPPLRLLSVHIILHLHVCICIQKISFSIYIYILHVHMQGTQLQFGMKKAPSRSSRTLLPALLKAVEKRKVPCEFMAIYLWNIKNVSLSNDFIIKLLFVHFWS